MEDQLRPSPTRLVSLEATGRTHARHHKRGASLAEREVNRRDGDRGEKAWLKPRGFKSMRERHEPKQARPSLCDGVREYTCTRACPVVHTRALSLFDAVPSKAWMPWNRDQGRQAGAMQHRSTVGAVSPHGWVASGRASRHVGPPGRSCLI